MSPVFGPFWALTCLTFLPHDPRDVNHDASVLVKNVIEQVSLSPTNNPHMKSRWRCRKCDLSEERDFWRVLKSGLRVAAALATVFVIVFVLCSAAGQPSPAPEAKSRMGGSASLCPLHPDWHICKSLNHTGGIQAHGWSPVWHRSRSLEHRSQYLADLALAFIPAAACAAAFAPWFFNISSCMALSVGQQMCWWGTTVVTAFSATAALLWEHHYHMLQVFSLV